MYPQEIKLTTKVGNDERRLIPINFCPFKLVNDYIDNREEVLSSAEEFFVFRGRIPVTTAHARKLLKDLLTKLGLNPSFYGMHSFRIGHCTDMIKFGATIEEAKRAGQWKLSAVYKYLR